MTREIAAKLVKEHGKNEKDSGNPRTQIALLTHRIAEITEHLKVHKKDKHTRRGLTTLVAQRRRLLNYMTRTDLEGYRALIKQLDLRR
ncbi:MAG TPA: 30S ribosomal protein S15 [Fibrobacteres bacterium]|jgi:small subunit ribosomal protein S15|nr:30S ribosomal protein S15 [Fibrobacterota bacterium]